MLILDYFVIGFCTSLYTMESDRKFSSSSFSSVVPRRTYSCGTRMTSIQNDPHLNLATCVGYQCSKDKRCDGCKDWSYDVMGKSLNTNFLTVEEK